MACKEDLYNRVIPELKPDLVIAIENDYLDVGGPCRS